MSGVVHPCSSEFDRAINNAPDCGKNFSAHTPKPSETFVGYPVATVHNKITPEKLITPEKQHHGNCAVQTASQIISIEKSGDKPGRLYNEEQMEVLANCPEPSGYRRSKGTTPKGSMAIYKNAGVITCVHRPTLENIQAALEAGAAVSTGHNAADLWHSGPPGGHRVTTVGYLRDSAGNPTAFLVSDTGTGCTYYVPADRYKRSLNSGPIIIAIGHMKDCHDKKTGKPFDRANCCLEAHSARRRSLLEAANSQPNSSINQNEKEKAHKKSIAFQYKNNIAKARNDKEMQRIAYAKAHQEEASATNDEERLAAHSRMKYFQHHYWMLDKYEKEQLDSLFLIQDTITPMSSNDPDAAKICAACNKHVECKEVRRPCPVCKTFDGWAESEFWNW